MKRNNEEFDTKNNEEELDTSCRYGFYPHYQGLNTDWYISPKLCELTETDKKIISTLKNSISEYSSNFQKPSASSRRLVDKCMELVRRKLGVGEFDCEDEEEEEEEDEDEDDKKSKSEFAILCPKGDKTEAESLGSNWIYLDPTSGKFISQLSEISKLHHLILTPFIC